jgi:uncharacterized membrane protein
MWDLVYIAGIKVSWFSGKGAHIWQQSICWTFILLSGFCFSLGRKPLKRGLTVFAGGALVSVVTCIAMPDSRILFGVLTCLGSCMILLALIEKWVKKIPNAAGLIGSFAAFAVLRNVSGGSLGFENWVICQLPEGLYRNYFTAYLGFPQRGFYSTDYFPLIPWFFLFLTGFFLFRILDSKNLNGRLFSRGQIPVLNWLGRNSLLVYLLHQPILYGLCLILF